MTEPIDPIDVYLDEVCKALPFAQSDEKMAEGWRKAYGIDVSADAFTALPENFRIMIETSRSERDALRDELREHLVASVARIEVGGVDHVAAVNQAVAEFGNARRLNRLLRREFTGTVKERVRKVLDDHDRAQTKQSKLLGWWWTCVRVWPLVIPATLAMDYGKSPTTAMPWITLVPTVSLVSSFFHLKRSRTERQSLEAMRSMFAAPNTTNRTLKQRANSIFIRSLVGSPSDRRSPFRILGSLAFRIALLAFFWFGPLTGELKFYLFYYCLAFLGNWLGELSASFLENRRTSEA